MTGGPEILDLHFSRAQWAFWTATERYVDFEGAVRAGKTTPGRSGQEGWAVATDTGSGALRLPQGLRDPPT